jgi:hypothetical protein
MLAAVSGFSLLDQRDGGRELHYSDHPTGLTFMVCITTAEQRVGS